MNRKKYLVIIAITLLISCVLIGCGKSKYDGSIEKGKGAIDIESYKDLQGVKAFFIENQKGIIYKFVIYGESNYSEYGTDIVAAAVSSLSINTINSINEFTNVEMDYDTKEYNNKPYLECELNRFSSKSEQDKALVLMEALKLGLSQIQEQYGAEYIEVIVMD